LNATKFVVFVFAASLAPAPALLVSGVGAGVGSAALESRRDRRAVVVGVRESEDDRYFLADAVDVGGGRGITKGLFVSETLERGARGIDLVGETLDLPVNVLALFGDTLGPLSEDGSSTLLRRE
jgi:hypothetical protein